MKEKKYYNLTFKEVKEAMIAYDHNLFDLDMNIFYSGEPITNWSDNVTIYVEGKKSIDYIFYPMSPMLPVSKKVQQTLISANIEGIQFLPIRVENKNGCEILDYAILHVVDIIPALDYVHTVWVTDEKEKAQYPEMNIWEEALQLNSIIGKDIFRLAEMKTEIYVSQNFVNCLKKNNATLGFEFVKIGAY
jgi:hypothetical protein